MTEQNIIDTLIGICGFAVVWWVRTIWTMVIHQQEQITALNIKLAEAYVPRQELETTFTRIFTTMDEIKKEITHISRNQTQVTTIKELLKKE